MAGKRKNPADNWMPPRVYQGKAAYEFRNKDNKAIRLCALDAPRSAVWLAYEKAVGDEKERNTFQALTEQFMTSPDFMDLAVETRKDYTKYSGKVLPVFGRSTRIKSNLNIFGAIWINAVYQAELRQTGKKALCPGYSVGVMNEVMFRGILVRELNSLKRKLANVILRMKNIRPFMKCLLMLFA